MKTAILFRQIYGIGTILLSLSLSVNPLPAGEFLSAGEVSAITAGSGAVFWAGIRAQGGDTTRAPLIHGALPCESSLQYFLGGRYTPGKRNFLDNHFGSIVTPLVAGAALITVDLTRSYDDKEQLALQDGFLFLTGLGATKGITGIVKGIVSRPRPYMTLVPAGQAELNGFREDRASFFSGHASAAFFSAAYLNLRLRSVMRGELTTDEYRDWRWSPPTILFGWATFVGLSRIHAYKHYLSDVLTGALAGYLVAELFFSFEKDTDAAGTASNSSPVLLRMSFSF